jgi:hypothetical protein
VFLRINARVINFPFRNSVYRKGCEDAGPDVSRHASYDRIQSEIEFNTEIIVGKKLNLIFNNSRLIAKL